MLLDILKLARSIYYCQVKRLAKRDTDSELKAIIQEIYTDHQGRYGYRRIHLELCNQCYEISHKKVQRLMTELGLKARVRAKHRYNFYKGEMGLRLNI